MSTPQEQETTQETKLVPTEVYLKAGIHVGTKFKTKDMKPYIYKTRPDGLAVLNVELIDQRMEEAFKMLAEYNEDDIIVVCRRENGWKPLHLFKQATQIRGFPGRYPPGILTNTNLENFIEAKVMIVVDPWADKNAIDDALKMGIKIIALCDTNNQCNGIDYVLPCNNKGRKSLGLFFYLFAREYLKAKGKLTDEAAFEAQLAEFLED